MLREFSAFLLLSASVSAAYAQQTIEPLVGRTARSAAGFVFVDEFGGGYLGVRALEITKENFGKYGLREVRGVAVEKVVKDSPADRAGLQQGDVIVELNGEAVTSVSKLLRLLNEIAPDHQAKINVLRAGSENELTATIAKRRTTFPNGGFTMQGAPPDGFDFPRLPLPPAGSFALPNNPNVFIFRGSNRQIGVGVSPLSKQLADYFGIAGGAGLLVDNVRENSPAARAGIKAGDVIVEADGTAVKNNVDLIRALDGKKDGENIALTVIRDKNRLTVNVAPEVSKAAPVPFGAFENFNQPDGFRMQTPTIPTAPLPPLRMLNPLPQIL